MDALSVFRMDGAQPWLVGTISLDPVEFRYDKIYVGDTGARPISCSLPLREEPYGEDALMPYFEGLLPEGRARQTAAAELGIEPDNYLMLLYRFGLETIGDLAVTECGEPDGKGSYRPLDFRELKNTFADLNSLAESNSEAHLSLAGTQGKTGLAHPPDTPIEEGWLQPVAGAASTHILKMGALPDIPLLEYLCLRAAAACGIKVPEAHLLDFGQPVLCVQRYDRVARMEGERLIVSRLHQEDFAQALGVLPRAKYREVAPSTAATIAGILRSRSARPIEDLEAFAKITCFNYLVGNCDNHLKNLSVLYEPDWKSLRLAPLYDVVCTTRFERFSRTMGMRLGQAAVIDEVTPEDLLAFGHDIGLDQQELAELCHVVATATPPAIANVGESAPHFKALPYVADDLLEDLEPRLCVLKQVMQRR